MLNVPNTSYNCNCEKIGAERSEAEKFLRFKMINWLQFSKISVVVVVFSPASAGSLSDACKGDYTLRQIHIHRPASVNTAHPTSAGGGWFPLLVLGNTGGHLYQKRGGYVGKLTSRGRRNLVEDGWIRWRALLPIFLRLGNRVADIFSNFLGHFFCLVFGKSVDCTVFNF